MLQFGETFFWAMEFLLGYVTSAQNQAHFLSIRFFFSRDARFNRYQNGQEFRHPFSTIPFLGVFEGNQPKHGKQKYGGFLDL